MDLSAILNDVEDDRGFPAKGETDTAQITESRLFRLPVALHDSIISDLSNQDIKNLRLTCTFFRDIARLRLQRVFISAHHRDIQVLRAIADSETFRLGVTELIWDDARFSDAPHLAQAYDEYIDNEESEADNDEDDNVIPQWFANALDKNIADLKSRRGLDAYRPEHHDAQDEQLSGCLGPAACWEHYLELLRKQNAVIASGADEAAFRHALQRFPSLKRITITPAAHGFLFSPLYETPTIRAFPHGFVYPIPRGWPTAPDGSSPHIPWTWPDDNSDAVGEAYKDQWRGVRIALRVLAEPQTHHDVTELVLDAHHLKTGLNCNIFSHPASSAEYANLCALLRRPGFARLDLALAVGGQDNLGWLALRGGHLRAALAGATSPGLTHLSLRTDAGPLHHASDHVPLADILPVGEDAAWGARLRHFGLSGFLVTQRDVVALLAALSAGPLRSVELSFLHFVMSEGESWRGLLREMRDSLGWRELEARWRPDVVVGHAAVEEWPRSGRAVWAGREAVRGFLYGDGPNPFGEDGKHSPYKIVMGNGVGVELDAFDPSYERRD